MNTSLRRLFASAVVSIGVASLAACSSGQSTSVPLSDGWGPSGGNVAGSSSETASSSSGGGSGSGSAGSGSGTRGGTGGGGSGTGGSSGSGGASLDAGSGHQPYPDAGSGGVDASPPKAAAPGTCANPNCGTDTNECGCQATDSAGETVLLGCQAGGDCVCLVNGQPAGQPFPEDNACSDEVSTRLQFLTNCACQ